MEYRILGKTKLKVSSIGMGGIPLQRVNDQEAEKLVNLALDQGINFFDTARGYTDSEAKFGRVFRKRRQEAVIATKSMARTRTGIMEEVERSLEALQVDNIDLYQLHNVRTMAGLEQVLSEEGALPGLKEAKKLGKIKHIGITGHVLEVLEKAIETVNFETVQFPFNAIELKAAEKLIPLAREQEMGMIVMKPVAGGAIPTKDLALRFLLGFPVASIIPGMDETSQILENIAIGNKFSPLQDEEKSILMQAVKELGESFCRRCEYCLPCPEGINIPMIFILDGYWQRYGLKEWAKERYLAQDAKGDSCIDCGTCSVRCPYGLAIPELLTQVHKRMG